MKHQQGEKGMSITCQAVGKALYIGLSCRLEVSHQVCGGTGLAGGDLILELCTMTPRAEDRLRSLVG